MRYRALVAFPVVFALLVAIVVAMLPWASHEVVFQIAIDTAKFLALIGLSRAALAFEPGEYLRRGWGLFAFCYVLLLARDAALLLPAAPLTLEVVRAIIVTIANVCLVVAVWTLARAWTVAGLEFPGTPATRRAVIAAAIVAAILLAGPELYIDVRDTITGHGPGYGSIGSDVGDILALPLIAPVAMTALAVRGGLLRWTWMLLASSFGAWLAFDLFTTFPELFHVPRAPFQFLAAEFHLLAVALACAAGFAQGLALTDETDHGM
jgi:hypothetical protein